MKNFICYILLIFIIHNIAISQGIDYNKYNTKPIYNSILKTNLLVPFWGNIPLTGEYRLALETRLTQRFSAEVTAAYLGPSLLILMDSTYKEENLVIKGYRFKLQFRYYLSKRKVLQNFYLSADYSYANAIFSTDYYLPLKQYIVCTHKEYSGLLGFQRRLGWHIYMDFQLGICYRKKKWADNINRTKTFIDYDDSEMYLIRGPVRPVFNWLIGYGF